MTELEQEHRELAGERVQNVGFEGYRQVVDELSPAFRKVGLVEAGGYGRAMRDPRTVRLRIGEVEMPLVTPIEHVSGYDVERTGRLTGQENAYVMTMPFNILTSPGVTVLAEESEFLPEGSAIVVETDHAQTAETQQLLPGALDRLGSFELQQFLDTRIRNPEQQPAMMAMYETQFVALDDKGEQAPPSGKDFFEAYDELVAANHPITQNTKLFRVEELRENEQFMDELWELCRDRFDWLGEAHPVSMEDTKDFFVQMIMNDDTHTIVRYDEGKPVCLGFFMSSLNECTWLKPEFQDDLDVTTKNAGEVLTYFYGIAGKATEAAVHYGRDVMQLLSYIAQRRGGAHRLFFESTNMSSRYIPRLVRQYIGPETGMKMTEPISKVAQMDYWYLAPKPTAG